MEVFKFGGASVKDAQGVKNVANIIQQHQDKKLLVVVSAMGKTTNLLEKLVQAYFSNHPDDQNIYFQQLKTECSSRSPNLCNAGFVTLTQSHWDGMYQETTMLGRCTLHVQTFTRCAVHLIYAQQ